MSCPDFDLCENCEAHPIPVHPPTHHMLKMKTLHVATPSPAPATHIRRTYSSSSDIEPTTTRGPSAEVIGVDSAPVVRTPTTASQPSQPSESNGIAISISELSQAPSVPDLITFPEMSQMQNISTSSPTLPEVQSTVPLVPDLSVPVWDSPIAVCLPQVSEMSAAAENTNQVVSVELSAATDNLKNETTRDRVESPARSITPYVPGSLTPSDVSSVPRIANFNHEQWRDLWPEMKDMINSILQPVSVTTGNTNSSADAVDPPAPVIRPIIYAKLPSDKATTTISTPSDLASIAADEGIPALSSPADKLVSQATVPSPTHLGQSPTPSNHSGIRFVEADAPLRATFLSDNNIPDGQIFPPGAEFVKSWKMWNDGTRDWPETSQLIFVAGDKLTSGNDQGIVHIGLVPVGAEIDVWTGEMKVWELIYKCCSCFDPDHMLGS
jgi:next to BRCA1 gene 1 protein